MNELLGDKLIEVFSVLFGAGGIGYAIITRILDRKKYAQEVRDQEATADLKSEEFWKGRYDILQRELDEKNDWWKARYQSLYEEFQNERNLSNQIISSFRTELNEMRAEYERQREMERQKYNTLIENYRNFESESHQREVEYKQRINQLEKMVSEYEDRLKNRTL